jgi:uncharacterized membrane protein YidH (DUF202 family)
LSEERGDRSEQLLNEADRMTLQILQASLSLIGFGFSLHAFFVNVADRAAFARPDLIGRRLGIAFLLIGLVLLTSGVAQQWRYRRRLAHRWTPGYVAACLLLGAGLMAFASIIWRGLL